MTPSGAAPRPTHKRIVASAVVVALLAAVVAVDRGPLSAAAAPPDPAGTAAAIELTDIDGTLFEDAILWLVAQGVTTGFDDGTFRPLLAVSRQAMAAFLYRYAVPGDEPAPPCTEPAFTDVPVSHQFCAEIAWLAEQGITTGKPDGSYGVADPVSRQAMAAFLFRLASPGGGATETCIAAPFSDVGIAHPFCAPIVWMVDQEITTGKPDGSYGVADPVSRQVMAAFLFRLDATRAGPNQPAEPVQGLDEDDDEFSFLEGGPELPSVIEYEPEVPAPVIGQLIALQTAGGAFYGRVTQVDPPTPDGRKVVHADPVSLDEVLPEFDIQLEVDSETGAIEAVVPEGSPQPVFDPIEASGGFSAGTGAADVTCTGSAGAAVEVDATVRPGTLAFDFRWAPPVLFQLPRVARAELVYRPDIELDASASVAGAVSCEVDQTLLDRPLPTIVFWIGIVPVVITQNISANIGASVSTEGSATIATSASVEGGFGVRYENGVVSAPEGLQVVPGPVTAELAVEATARVQLVTTYGARLYGAAGLDVSVTPYAELVLAPLDDPWAHLDAGIEGSLDAVVEIPVIDEPLFEHTLAEVDLFGPVTIWSSTGPPPTTTTTSTSTTSTSTTTTTQPPPEGLCADQVQIPVSECDALEDLFESADGYEPGVGYNWYVGDWFSAAEQTPCTWTGVQCAGGHVTGLFLSSRNLYGPLPQTLGSLPHLTHLDLSQNQLTGLIPSGIGSLAQLTNLQLGNNRLRGAIPEEVVERLDNGPVSSAGFGYNRCLTVAPGVGNEAIMTSADPEWNNGCNPGICEDQPYVGFWDCFWLIILYQNTNGASWVDNTGWASHPNPCTWFGVVCDDRATVERIFLEDNGLTGTLGTLSFANLDTFAVERNAIGGTLNGLILPRVRYLTLADNTFTGAPIGPFWNEHLRYLYLDENALSGLIPLSGEALAMLDGALFRGNGCLTAFDAAAGTVLDSLDPIWDNGCP